MLMTEFIFVYFASKYSLRVLKDISMLMLCFAVSRQCVHEEHICLPSKQLFVEHFEIYFFAYVVMLMLCFAVSRQCVHYLLSVLKEISLLML